MNRVFRSIFLATALCLLTAQTQAQSQRTDIRPDANRLLESDILENFSGVTHNGAYNFTEAGEPRRFYVETTGRDGRTDYQEQDHVALGDWFVEDDTLCFAYDNDTLSSGCFRVYRLGNCFYYYTTELILSRDELDRDYWTARSVKAGEATNCEPGLS